MKKLLKIIAPLLLLSWMLLIFYLSNQPASVSSNTSGSFIRIIIDIFIEDFESLDALKQEALYEQLQFIVRKTAHFTLYFILGIFSFASFATYNSPPLAIRSLVSFVICVLYSASDEVHQLYIPGRSGEIRDVLIDSSGSLLAVVILYFIARGILKKSNQISKGGTMRKKDLIKLNEELFLHQQETERELRKIAQENQKLKAELVALKEQREKPAATETVAETPLEKLEEKILAAADITDDTKYGAEIIGKIVVLAAKRCNELTAASNSNENTKELVNLILGRTEIAKAEILSVTQSEAELEVKKELIDAQLTACEDYFNSIMAQK